jgi:hypothetical protein
MRKLAAMSKWNLKEVTKVKKEEPIIKHKLMERVFMD